LHPRKVVKEGYDSVASAYRVARKSDSKDVQLLRILVEKLPKSAIVLDAGCGSGYPVSQLLAESFEVTGLDFSSGQLRLARERSRSGAFVQGDIVALPFRDETFDGIVSYYAIIHVPRSQHRELLLDFHRVLKPDGLVLLCMGAGDLPSDTGEFFGTRMFWSHYNGTTNLSLLKETGFKIFSSQTITDPIDPPSEHLFVLALKSREKSL
jgi:ubiquinone/menaquinone biosynthesis C-methylase UbiE